MHPKLPKDIKKYVTLHIIKQILACAVPLAAALAVMKLFGERIFTGQGQSIVTAYVLVIAVVLYLTKFPKRYIDSTFTGEITNVKVETTEQRKGKGDWGLPSYYHKNTLYIDVKTDSGKTVRKIAYEGEADQELLETHLKVYKVGARVLHVYGTKHIQVLDDDRINCVICGDNNPKENKKCHVCGHSLHIGE